MLSGIEVSNMLEYLAVCIAVGCLLALLITFTVVCVKLAYTEFLRD